MSREAFKQNTVAYNLSHVHVYVYGCGRGTMQVICMIADAEVEAVS